MISNPEPSEMGKMQRIFLLLAGLMLAALIFFLRGGFSSQAPLDQLAKRSISPETALTNGNPTIFEFYADWCEVCRGMAPLMLELESEYEDKIDFVMLNVDNVIWEDLISKYEVNGIPQLNFFNANGELLGKSLGLQSKEQLQQIIWTVLENKPSPEYLETIANTDATISSLAEKNSRNLFRKLSNGPRDHS